MKPVNVKEVDEILGQVQKWLGGRVQEFYSTDRDLILELYLNGQTQFLWIDMSPAAPMIALLETFPRKAKKKPSPAMLFSKAHLRGRYLNFAERDQTHGRVILLKFSGEGDATMEIRLFPHGQNILIACGEKKIAWAKPKTMDAPKLENNGQEYQASSFRPGSDLVIEWSGSRNDLFEVKKTGAVVSALPGATAELLEVQRKLVIDRKETIVRKLQGQLVTSRYEDWRNLGEFLKANQNLNVPVDLSDLLVPEKDLAGNIQNSFAMSKIEKKKRDGLAARIAVIQKEIAALNEGSSSLGQNPQAEAEQNKKTTAAKSRKQDGKSADSRTCKFADGIILNVGKSAQDNMRLLRAAQPWDLWLHVRDVAGCHGILRRNRNQLVPDEVLRAAASRVVELTTKAARQFEAGDQFDVIVCEARFVKPIKGDQVGHVTLHNERTIRVRYATAR